MVGEPTRNGVALVPRLREAARRHCLERRGGISGWQVYGSLA